MLLNLAIGFIIVMLIIFLLGLLMTKYMGANEESITFNYICGMVVFLSIFQIMFLPSVFLRFSFNTAFLIVLSGIILLCLTSIYLNRRRFKKILFDTMRIVKGLEWIWVSAIGLLIFSIIFSVTQVFGVNRDDPNYVGTALSVLHTNTITGNNPYTGELYEGFYWKRLMSPFPHYWAFLSRLLYLHPAVIARTLLPVFLIVFCFCIFYNIGKRLFDGNVKKAASFLLIYQLLLVITSTSQAGHGFWYLLMIHWGKSLIVVAFVPLCIYQYLRLSSPDARKIDWILLCAITLASCLVSAMGITLSAVTIGLLGMTHLILKRDIKFVCYMAICCIPNVIFGLLFAVNTGGFEIGM